MYVNTDRLKICFWVASLVRVKEYMRLTHVTVSNFKSVEDSGEFSIGDVTCLVGKNEAGKTALLQALDRLNPDSGEAIFDIESSYPRRFLSEYQERHPDGDAVIKNYQD